MVEVGWVLTEAKGAFLWEAPRSLSRDDRPPRHAKAVGFCPAVLDHEARLAEVACPFDLQLRFRYGEGGRPELIDVAGERSAIRPRHLAQLVTVIGRAEWRHPDRPVLQIRTPLACLADEPVYMTQLPPFGHYRDQPWPGLVIGGRLPIHIWPRQLMWAFEWHDPAKDLILSRGEPWFYLRFETPDATRPVRLVEAELTPELVEYMAGIAGVTNYVKRTFSLFATAQRRRPPRLLVKRARAF